MENREKCHACGQNISERQIALYRGMVTALWEVLKWAKGKNVHEFTRKDIKHLFTNENSTARFGDWVMFGGLVYKEKKGHYGVNVGRCDQFFAGTREIPTIIWKDPLTGDLRKEAYKTIDQIPSLVELLNKDLEYRAIYPAPKKPISSFEVQSKSNPGAYHTVTKATGEEWECTCAGFQYRQKCRHVDEVLSYPQTTQGKLL